MKFMIAIAITAVCQAQVLMPTVNAGSQYKGSLVGVAPNAALTTVSWYPGTLNSTGCGTAGGMWLVPGVFRNVTAKTSNTNGASPVSVGVDTGCTVQAHSGATAFTAGPASGGPVIGISAAAGGFTSPATGYVNAWHQDAYWPFAFAGFKNALTGVTAATVVDIAAEFADDAGQYHSVVPNGSSTALTASTTQFIGFYGTAASTTELINGMPIPVAGTIDGVAFCNSTAPTATFTVTLRKGTGSGSASSTANTFTMPTAIACGYDQADTVVVAAGDWITLQTVSGTTTQGNPISSQISFRPTSGTSTIVGGYIGGTITTTKNFNAPLTKVTSATEASAETVLPVALTCTNLYIVKATANSGVTTTYTIRDNEADTAITGTESSGTGAIALYTSAGVSIAAGHRIDLAYSTASGTSGTMSGWSMSCQ